LGGIKMKEDKIYFKDMDTCEIKTENEWFKLGKDIMDDNFKMVFAEGLDEDGDEIWSEHG
jgi:hypothetical protein